MGYIYTVILVLLGATKWYCGKTGSRYMQRGNDAVLLNTFRMLISAVLSVSVVTCCQCNESCQCIKKDPAYLKGTQGRFSRYYLGFSFFSHAKKVCPFLAG